MAEKIQVKMRLKKDQPGSIEISVGSKTIAAKKGKAIAVDTKDVQRWLSTGRFEIVEESEEAPPTETKQKKLAKAEASKKTGDK